jgi:hypothetical protein
MKAHSIILHLCLVIAAGCLAAGYLLGGYWLIAPVFLAMAIFGILARRQSAFWAASSLLLIYVVLAVIGVTLNLSIDLMVIGCAAALACWDLIHFRQSIADNLPLESDPLLERYRLQSLAAAVAAGLSLTWMGSSINLQFPFGVMVFLALMVMGCLTYGLHHLSRKR